MSDDKRDVARHEGGCLCGHVRFRITGKPNNVSNCHCRLCQKAAGAPYITWVEFPQVAVAWLSAAPQWRASSEKAERGFCPECGGAVSFRYAGGDNVDLAVALFDHPESFPPTHDIFTESAQPWTPLDPTIPHYKRERE